MRLELYQEEAARIATEQTALLDEARQILASGKLLSRLEQSGVLHALQVLTENAIGKAKQLLKASSEPVPVSAYDAFASLARLGSIDQADLEEWNSAIGPCNRSATGNSSTKSGYALRICGRRSDFSPTSGHCGVSVGLKLPLLLLHRDVLMSQEGRKPVATTPLTYIRVGKASAPAHAPYLHPCRQSPTYKFCLFALSY